MSNTIVITGAAMRPLSPSQITTWQTCQAKWFYSRELDLPDPGSITSAVGRAVHETQRMFMRGRQLGRTLNSDQIAVHLANCLQEELPTDDYATPAFSDALGMIQLWVQHVAPSLDPLHVEHPISGTINGIEVRGIVDLVQRDGSIRDCKTTGRTPGKLTGGQRLQAALYATLLNSDSVTFDVLVNLKREKRYVPLVLAGDELLYEQDYLARNLPVIHEQLNTGLIVPNRLSSLCSRKYCAFADECEADYGGKVPGGDSDD